MSKPLLNMVRREVERAKNSGGMRAGLPTVKIDAAHAELLCDLVDRLQQQLKDEAQASSTYRVERDQLWEQMEQSQARIAQLTTALSDAKQIIESDANTPENYGSLCRIGSALRTGEGSAQAWLLRKQAQAVKEFVDKQVPQIDPMFPHPLDENEHCCELALHIDRARIRDAATMMALIADELEQAGGDA